MSASQLPDYVASAQPVSKENRIPWYKSTAQTYAGIMLWFVFWQNIPLGKEIAPGSAYSGFAGGMLSHGIVPAIIAVILAGLFCHFLFYLVPALLGLRTGLPLYIVGTSTYGVLGGLAMPGFFMGVLQFGWLGVNGYFSGLMLSGIFGHPVNGGLHMTIGVIWIILATIVGLKGIKYVAGIATFLPILPFAILIVLFVATVGGLGSFDPAALVAASNEVTLGTEKVMAEPALSSLNINFLLITYIVGFFATAGAAGADFGSNNRSSKDVQLGGLVGVTGSIVFTGVMAILIVAGAHGLGKIEDPAVLQVTEMINSIVGTGWGKAFIFMLAIAAFPSSCFPALIAANSFRTTLPKIPPFISCGLGALGSIALVITAKAGDAMGVFTIIGASFGPICGAMMADWLLSGRKWGGPRAGFNMAGWLSWAIGFFVAAGFLEQVVPALEGQIPCKPMVAFIIGFVLYAIFAKIGLQSRSLEMPKTCDPTVAK
jgi:purine-cytosine permease-like protein